jgi:hypothetical protein
MFLQPDSYSTAGRPLAVFVVLNPTFAVQPSKSRINHLAKPKSSGPMTRAYDTGGVGDLPDAPEIYVANEATLKVEIDGIAATLAPDREWGDRVTALLRLEGLTKGGAAEYPSFVDHLLTLRNPLAMQLIDRRSAVSRVACHVISVLTSVCGAAFEPMAIDVMAVLFRAMAMGIQVVTELADGAARDIMRHCPAPRLLPGLCTMVVSDKNGKLRNAAAEYLLLALEEWDPHCYERLLMASIEPAILAAARDAQSDTRTAGRAMFVAFARNFPWRVQPALKRLPDRDRDVAAKLMQAVPKASSGACFFFFGFFPSHSMSFFLQGQNSKVNEFDSTTDGHLVTPPFRSTNQFIDNAAGISSSSSASLVPCGHPPDEDFPLEA